MMKDIKFRNQFVMAKSIEVNFLQWDFVQIADYRLFYHQEIKVSVFESTDKMVVSLGDLYDYRNVSFTNSHIINELAELSGSFDELIKNSFKYSGTFIVIYLDKKNSKLYLFNDNAAQREVYYLNKTSDEMIFGSQPNIINLVSPLTEDNSEEARLFYQSDAFKKRASFVGDSTNFVGLKHLKPNYYIDIDKQESIRFFPNSLLPKISLKEGALRVAEMIKGYVKAASERYPLLIPVSAGWESRVLLAASKDVVNQSKYFVYQHPNMTDTHQDIVIPKRLFEILNIDFNVIKYSNEINQEYLNQINESVSFPRYNVLKYIINGMFKHYPGFLCLNGNISEVGRKEHERIYNLTPVKIAYLQKYANSSYAIKRYERWVSDNKPVFDKFNFSIADMLYWEENCGNWVAKSKTEAMTVAELYSPFNSRELLITLLSVNEKYRGKQNPVLYKHIIKLLWKEVLLVPVNPSLKLQVIKVLQKIGIYTLYRNVLLNFKVFMNAPKQIQ